MNESLKDLIGLAADDIEFAAGKCWYAGNTGLPGPFPVLVDLGAEYTACKKSPCLLIIESGFTSKIKKYFRITYILVIDKISPEQQVMDIPSTFLGIGPATKFLCEPAVVSHGAIAIGQSGFFHQVAHIVAHG